MKPGPGGRDRRGGPDPLFRRVNLLRKLMHLAMAWLPAVGWLLSYRLALALAGVLVGASLMVEGMRRHRPEVNRLLWRLLPSVFREWESRRVLGSTWFALAALAALLLFGRDLGGTAILFLAWGDAAAELVGRRWGQAGQGKSLAGSLGCLVACLMGGLAGSGWGGLQPEVVLVGAAVATLVERWSPPPDDNLWLPLLAGLAMEGVTCVLVGG